MCFQILLLRMLLWRQHRDILLTLQVRLMKRSLQTGPTALFMFQAVTLERTASGKLKFQVFPKFILVFSIPKLTSLRKQAVTAISLRVAFQAVLRRPLLLRRYRRQGASSPVIWSRVATEPFRKSTALRLSLSVSSMTSRDFSELFRLMVSRNSFPTIIRGLLQEIRAQPSVLKWVCVSPYLILRSALRQQRPLQKSVRMSWHCSYIMQGFSTRK